MQCVAVVGYNGRRCVGVTVGAGRPPRGNRWATGGQGTLEPPEKAYSDVTE